jgi:hypothetical protein
MLRKLRQQVFENLGIKVTSLILALAVYAHVYSQQDHVLIARLPVAVEGLPANLAYRGDLPAAVPVRIRVKGGELFKLRSQPPRFQVNLSQARPGPLQRPLTVGDVWLPPDVEVKAEALVEPAVLSLQIEPMEKASLPVSVSLKGSPAQGLVPLGPATVWPESVAVSGPASVLDRLGSIPTEEVDLAGRSQTVRETVGLRFPSGVRAKVEQVSIRLPLVAVGHRDFGEIAVSLPPEMRGLWRVHPDSVRVRLAGPEVLLQAVPRASLHPRARPAAPYAAEDQVPVDLVLPPALRDRVTVESIEPATVALAKGRR